MFKYGMTACETRPVYKVRTWQIADIHTFFNETNIAVSAKITTFAPAGPHLRGAKT